MNGNKLENSVNNGTVQLPEIPAPDNPKSKNFTFACAILASMTSILIGYDGAVTNGAVTYIQNELKFNDVQAEVLVGIFSLSCLISSAVAGKTSDMVGRRYTIILAAASYFVGAVLMGTAMNYMFLIVGGVVAGIGGGLALAVAPVYIAEVSPASSRGFLTSFPELFTNFGCLLGSVSNWCFPKLSLRLGWRLVLGIGAVPSVFMGLAVLVIPESARWLVLQGRLADARRVLVKISNTKEEAHERLMSIQEAAGIPLDCTDEVVKVAKVKKGHEVWKELLIHPAPGVRRVLIATVGLHFFQQASGMNAVVIYSPRIFKNAEIVTENAELGVSVAVEFTKTIAITIAAFFIDKVGRRAFLLSSVAGMILSLILLATGITVVHQNSEEQLTWAIALCMAAVFSYTAFFSMGLGPVTSVYSSEIFPLKLRAQGHSIGVTVSRVVSATITMTFLSMTKAITIGGGFFLFAGVATVALVFFYTCLPETRGRNLEDMDVLFGFSTSKRKQNNKDVKNGQPQESTTTTHV